ADLYLAMASLEDDITERMKWVNQALSLTDEDPITLNQDNSKDAYDRLVVANPTSHHNTGKDAKVTVIIPVYNAASVIDTSLTSIQKQTWENLEIIVVDDCSSDDTYNIVQTYTEKDDRIKLLQTKENSGAYTARNTALNVATGDFVTINDADDWS